IAAVSRLLLRYLYRKLVDDPDLPPPEQAPPPLVVRVTQRESAAPPRMAPPLGADDSAMRTE
ncbi:MAG TPA: hypothetical protein VGJ87_09055, partial [Roseiflexaceae bacterium]